MVEEQIVAAVRQCIRNGYHNRRGGVYPWMVMGWLEFDVSERTIRRRMRRMAEDGQLVRLGRKTGYRLPSGRMGMVAALQ